MTDTDKKEREALSRLVDVLVEDLLGASDEELLAEFAETQGDPAKNVAEMRAPFAKSVLKANKDRVRTAKAGLAAGSHARLRNCQHERCPRASAASPRILPS
jgi:hypothetical protein